MNDERRDELTDEELEAVIRGMVDRAVAATDEHLRHRPPPDLVSQQRRLSRARVRQRAVVYGFAAAAGVAAVVIGVNVADTDEPTAPTAASPSTTTTAPPTTTVGPIASINAQLEADRAIAAEAGFVIGAIDDDPPPDLVAVIEGDVVLGYTLLVDQETLVGQDAYVAYGPDGTTVVGVWSSDAGFLPIPQNDELPPTLGEPAE